MSDLIIKDEEDTFLNNSEEDDKNAKEAEDIMTNPFQMDTFAYSTSGSVTNSDIESIINTLGDGSCIVPGFQRKFVWKKEQVAGLAFSVLKGIPVPPIYVYYDEEDGRQVILDGQQRMTAVFLYFHSLFFSSETKRKKINFMDIHSIMNQIYAINSRIADGENEKELKENRKKLYAILKEKYELVDAKYEVSGERGQKREITFAKLQDREKRFVKRKSLQFAVVQCSKGEDPQKFYTMVFKMLNSGGKNLGPQEIRNGLYWKTKLYKGLFDINESNNQWRNIYGNISLYSKDVELLLKMLSLNYYTVMNENQDISIDFDRTFNWVNIMDDYSKESKKWIEEKIEKELSTIDSFLRAIELDADAKECKKAVLEAVFVAINKLCLTLDENHRIKMSWLVALSKNEDIFGEGKVLSNKNSVQTRLTKTLPLVRAEYGKYTNNSRYNS